MKKLLLIVFLALSSARALLASDNHAYAIPGKLAVEWLIADETRVWLSVNTCNHRDWLGQGYHPSYTNVISQYKPIVHKLSNGQWEITFTSEIAADLP